MSALDVQMLRGFRGALRTAGIVFTWTRPSPLSVVTISMIKNPLPPIADGVDRNQGDNAPCQLAGAVEDIPGLLPAQNDTLNDASGRIYRVASVEHVPGHPLFYLSIGHIAPAP